MIRTFFGNPGAGKTTLACKMLLKNQKRYRTTYANFDHCVPGSGTIDAAELGIYTPPVCSYLAIDEAGIQFNNRNYKALPKHQISWFKLHRHFGVDVDVFSQSWEDIDVTLRRLSPELWYMMRIGPFTLCRRVYKRVTVNRETEQIIDGYKMASLAWLLIWPLQLGYPFEKKFTLTFRPFYYKYFDSWSHPDLPLFPLPAPQHDSAPAEKTS